MRLVVAEADADDPAELDILVADRRARRLVAADLDALGVGEADRDDRPAIGDAVNPEPGGDQQRDDRPRPDPGQPCPGPQTWRRQPIVGISRMAHRRSPRAASHISRGSKIAVASIVRTTTAAMLTIPASGATAVR